MKRVDSSAGVEGAPAGAHHEREIRDQPAGPMHILGCPAFSPRPPFLESFVHD